MNQLKIQLVGLLIVLFTLGGVYSLTREDELKYLNNNTAVVADKCFESFLRNMKNLGAVIYIPDSKLEKGKNLGLTPVEEGTSTEAYEFYSFFDQVQPLEKPNDDCYPSLKLNFDELQMIVFVQKSKSPDISRAGLQKTDWKLNGVKYKIEGKHTLSEKLHLKFTNSTLTYVPVEWKMAER